MKNTSQDFEWITMNWKVFLINFLLGILRVEYSRAARAGCEFGPMEGIEGKYLIQVERATNFSFSYNGQQNGKYSWNSTYILQLIFAVLQLSFRLIQQKIWAFKLLVSMDWKAVNMDFIFMRMGIAVIQELISIQKW